MRSNMFPRSIADFLLLMFGAIYAGCGQRITDQVPVPVLSTCRPGRLAVCGFVVLHARIIVSRARPPPRHRRCRSVTGQPAPEPIYPVARIPPRLATASC
jgi:hypothetical protein